MGNFRTSISTSILLSLQLLFFFFLESGHYFRQSWDSELFILLEKGS